MALRFGREFLSIPGPSVIPDRVLQAMQRPAPNIYEGELIDMTLGILADLKRVARTQGEPIIYIANGHGAWEGAIANTFSRGDKALVLGSGRFAIGWGEMASAMGVEVELLDAGERAPVDPNRVEERLRADSAHEIKAVMVVQVDTASSVWNDVAAIRQAIDAAGHPALYMVDTIASLGSIPYEMDAWGVDVTVGGSQKGLMTPPGVSFNHVSPKAWEWHANADLRSGYWDWKPRAEPEVFYQRFAGTSPTHHLFALREALTVLLEEETLDGAWARHTVLANAVRATVAEWAKGNEIEFNIPDPAHRSDVVTTVLTNGINADRLREICDHSLGVVLGVGLGDFNGRAFRIGHMGWVNPPMVLGALGAAETAMASMGASYVSGLEAATRVIAKAALSPREP
jgi:alanine-glyoxylate transaminase/serine-glyoxylate transaminase/serine-pyruvate transaminase